MTGCQVALYLHMRLGHQSWSELLCKSKRHNGLLETLGFIKLNSLFLISSTLLLSSKKKSNVICNHGVGGGKAYQKQEK